jgi:hypothetical protein
MSLTLKERKAREAHLALIAEKTKNCSKKIEEILEKIYSDIKKKPHPYIKKYGTAWWKQASN